MYISLRQNPLGCQMIISTDGAKLNKNWHERQKTPTTKKCSTHFFFVHSAGWQLLSDTCHIKGEGKSDLWVCVYMHVHVCVYLCIKDALLIKLMDSLQSPVSSPPLSPLSPCSQLPTIKPINTLQQQILLSNVTRKIHYGAERGETAEGCRGGEGGQGEIKDQG